MNQHIKKTAVFSFLIILPVFLFSQTSKEIKRFKVKEARQGVAVDKDYFYVINNSTIVKYRKNYGRKAAEWDATAEGIKADHLRIERKKESTVVVNEIYSRFHKDTYMVIR